MTTLSQRLQKVRAEMHLTVDELAALCGLPVHAMWVVLDGGRVDDSLLDHGVHALSSAVVRTIALDLDDSLDLASSCPEAADAGRMQLTRLGR